MCDGSGGCPPRDFRIVKSCVDPVDERISRLETIVTEQKSLILQLINFMCPEALQGANVTMEEKLAHIQSVFDYTERTASFTAGATTQQQPRAQSTTDSPL